VIAEVETMAPRDQLLNDLRDLRTEVVRLRDAIAEGGTRAPPSIEQLLSNDSSRPPPVAAPARADNAPAAPAGPRPLGVPITTG
jgi:hypothetical protein